MYNDIIKKFNEGEKNALSELYNQVAKQIFLLGYAITDNSVDAEIVLKNSMVRISNEAYKFIDKKDAYIWILSIAREEALSVLKSGQNGMVYNTSEYLELISDNEAFLDTEVRKVLKKLGDKERPVLFLKKYLKLNDKAVGKILKISGMKVKSIYSKIVNILNTESIFEDNLEDIMYGLDLLEMPDKLTILSMCTQNRTDDYNRLCKKRKRIKKISLIFAVSVTCFLCIFGLIAWKYNKALTYCDKYNLEVGKLSIKELFDVYEDIVNEKFSLELTEEILKDTVYELAVDGKAIVLSSKDSVEDIWKKINTDETDYETYTPETDEYDFYVFPKGIVVYEEYADYSTQVTIEKTVDDYTVWTRTFENFQPYYRGGCFEWNGYYVVLGDKQEYEEIDNYMEMVRDNTYVYLLNMDGTIVWEKALQKALQNNDSYNSIEDVLFNEECISIVTSENNYEYIRLTEINIDGEIISKSSEIDIEGAMISGIERVGEDYAMLLGHYDGCKVLVLSKTGEIKKEYSFSDGDEDDIYTIVDYICSANGNIYLCGTECNYEYNFSDELLSGSKRDVAKYLRKTNRAILFVVDDKKGIEELYSITGGMQNDMSVNENGDLEWEVNWVKSYYEKPNGSVEGKNQKYKYVIDGENRLIEEYIADVEESF